jgi:cell division transport system permease protein
MKGQFMKSLKNHLSFIIPLFVLLFSIQFSTMLDRGIKKYETHLTGEYTIVVVSKLPLDQKSIQKIVPSTKTVEEIKKDKYIEKLKSDITKADLVYLRANLPKFYTLKLNALPDAKALKTISEKLTKIKGVTKVETFKKTFNKFHQFLKMSKMASVFFTIFIFIISFMLIIKQMEIWSLEHNRRMYIMGLFGAPFWMKSASLYKSVIIDALIAAVLVAIVFLLLPNIANLGTIKTDLGIDLNNFNFIADIFKLIVIALLISIISVTTIILKQKNS